MLIDCCPPGTRHAAVDLDFKRRRSKRGSIAGEDQSSLVAWERPVLLLRPPFLSPVGKSLSVARSRASHLRVEAWHHLLLYISTPVIPSAHRRPKYPSPGRRSRTSHLISLSATHMHVRHAAIPGIRIIPYHPFVFHRYSHGPPDHSVMLSESIFQNARCRSGLPTLAFPLSS
jgi:hypothetical protein